MQQHRMKERKQTYRIGPTGNRPRGVRSRNGVVGWGLPLGILGEGDTAWALSSQAQSISVELADSVGQRGRQTRNDMARLDPTFAIRHISLLIRAARISFKDILIGVCLTEVCPLDCMSP